MPAWRTDPVLLLQRISGPHEELAVWMVSTRKEDYDGEDDCQVA